MLEAPKCGIRECKHFQGMSEPIEGEEDGVFVCAAFPEGIPDEIVFGSNKHTSPYTGDNGIQYEKAEDLEVEE